MVRPNPTEVPICRHFGRVSEGTRTPDRLDHDPLVTVVDGAPGAVGLLVTAPPRVATFVLTPATLKGRHPPGKTKGPGFLGLFVMGPAGLEPATYRL
jgi:hypothetical protein